MSFGRRCAFEDGDDEQPSEPATEMTGVKPFQLGSGQHPISPAQWCWWSRNISRNMPLLSHEHQKSFESAMIPSVTSVGPCLVSTLCSASTRKGWRTSRPFLNICAGTGVRKCTSSCCIKNINEFVLDMMMKNNNCIQHHDMFEICDFTASKYAHFASGFTFPNYGVSKSPVN